MDISALNDAFDRISKKQKLSSLKTEEIVDKLTSEIQLTIVKLQATSEDPVDPEILLHELHRSLTGLTSLTQLESSQKELTSAVNKYVKAIDKNTNPDISRIYRSSPEFDCQTINQIIACHVYREGLFDLGDCFTIEAHEPASNSTLIKAPFLEMFTILEAMGSRNLEPALTWVQSQQDRLSDLELKLHGLQFIETLKKGDRLGALAYARSHLSPFATCHMAEVQKLMACLLWADRLDRSPYSGFLSPSLWESAAEELARQFCRVLGQSYESPLAVAVAAGVQALPTLLKLAGVMAGKKHEWEAMRQLPVAVELGKELQFHSIFVCPVSKEQAGEDNPPMLMPCGHALCRQSLVKLSKGTNRAFKCPYCPSEATIAQCRQLYL